MITFGRNPSPFDVRDGEHLLKYFIPQLTGLEQSRAWPYNQPPIDQADKPHCVGYAGVNWEINAPVESQHSNSDGDDLYHLCKEIEGEPGMDNGACIRSLAKALKWLHKLNAYAWAANTDEVSWWLLNKGPVICGTNWTQDMCVPTPEFVIQPTGQEVGGHGYIINEKKEGFYGIVSSWDNYWGLPGQCKAYITIEHFAELMRQGGEVMTAVENPVLTVPQEEGCLTAILNLFKGVTK